MPLILHLLHGKSQLTPTNFQGKETPHLPSVWLKLLHINLPFADLGQQPPQRSAKPITRIHYTAPVLKCNSKKSLTPLCNADSARPAFSLLRLLLQPFSRVDDLQTCMQHQTEKIRALSLPLQFLSQIQTGLNLRF